MKIFLLISYFLRSVALRGFIATLQLLKDEPAFEKKFGINSLGIKKSDSTEFFHYQGASYRVLLKVLREFYERTKHCEFVDIGCGKGRAVFVAEFSGYNLLTGIELDPHLTSVAIQNQQLYKLKRAESNISFIQANALDYSYKNTDTVYFLFNPFNETILSTVLDKIVQSSKSDTWFIYMNPMFQNPFKEVNAELIQEIKTGRYTEAIVYRVNRASVQS